jgi:hypothetical protein
MDNITTVSTTNESHIFNKNSLIIILIFLLIFSFLGINFLNIIGNFVQNVINLFRPLITGILSLFGYTTGVIIGKSADLATDVAKTGIDITHGTLQSVGDLLINSSQGNINPLAIQQIQSSTGMPNLQQSQQLQVQPQQPKLVPLPIELALKQPQPDTTTNPIQKPISSGKSNWCLVGEYQGRRGCIQVSEQNKCLSGQIFPNQQMCMNPAIFSDTNHPLKSVKE